MSEVLPERSVVAMGWSCQVSNYVQVSGMCLGPNVSQQNIALVSGFSIELIGVCDQQINTITQLLLLAIVAHTLIL